MLLNSSSRIFKLFIFNPLKLSFNNVKDIDANKNKNINSKDN
jgi:hypothetical protein